MSNITVTVTEYNNSVQVTENVTVVAQALSPGGANNISFNPYKWVQSQNLQGALEEIADTFHVQDAAPTAATSELNEGDLWYDTGSNQLMVYREVSPSNLDWRVIALAGYAPPIPAGSYTYADVDMEMMDGGNY